MLRPAAAINFFLTCLSLPCRTLKAGHSMMGRVCAGLCRTLCWSIPDLAVFLFNATWNKVMDEKGTHARGSLKDNLYNVLTTDRSLTWAVAAASILVLMTYPCSVLRHSRLAM